MPKTGQFLVRLDPIQHYALATHALETGQSQASLVRRYITEGLARDAKPKKSSGIDFSAFEALGGSR
jgi:hypothetical protein